MGVFKWLRRERLTVTTHVSTTSNNSSPENQFSRSATQIGTIRTDEYKRDLAEFQARRSSKDPTESEKKKCGRHSLPVSCTDCATDHDNTFNYEKKSAIKYKKKNPKRARSTTPDRTAYESSPVGPNIQFLFQNQVFMPGNIFPGSYTEPQKYKRVSRHRISRSPDLDLLVQKHIDFKDDEQEEFPPPFDRSNSLPYHGDKSCLDYPTRDGDVTDGPNAAGDVKISSQNSSSREDGDEKLWEVMSELKNFDQWADEQLHAQSPNNTKSDDCKSESSAYGLPIACASNLDVNVDKIRTWSHGKWGVVPIQIKKLSGVTVAHVKKKCNSEINILRKCRHPNIILLMGLYPDIHGNVHIICERCVDSIYGILHIQGQILSAQTAVQYALDVANALVFLKMQGYLHTELTSGHVMITGHDTAKLADVGSCVKLSRQIQSSPKEYDVYSPEPQYVNINDTRESNAVEFEPLISAHPSETYIACNAITKSYERYRTSEQYRWQAPELFTSNEDDLVFPCSKSDVYSLSLILWECCNAALPWKNFTYDKLKEQYTLWKTGVPLPNDGAYPGCLLSLLKSGLTLQRYDRIDLESMQSTLQTVKKNLDELGYIIIPARLPTRPSFSSTGWDTTPTDSESLSPQNIKHNVVVHKNKDSSTESEKELSEASPHYEVIRNHTKSTYRLPEKCYISDDETNRNVLYNNLQEKELSSACSTPIAKIRARIKDMETPGTLQRSDSTEYCSILSPNRTVNFADDSQQSVEQPAARLSRSFTPKSYKPLHIKVPEYNFDSVKSLLKTRNSSERSSYNFDIKNYSLPSTPIARSNKLRKNAWLSGEVGSNENSPEKNNNTVNSPLIPEKEEVNTITEPIVETTAINTLTETANNVETDMYFKEIINASPESVDTDRDHVPGLRRTSVPNDLLSPDCDDTVRHLMNSWSLKSTPERTGEKKQVEEDVLANVNVKPLVAIHERWIYEANRKTGRSMSLPEDNRTQIPAVKPASHCVDTLQTSLPQLNPMKNKPAKIFRVRPGSPGNGKHGQSPANCSNWEQFCNARDMVAKNINFARDPERSMRKKDADKGTLTESPKSESKMDQSTDTTCIEDFIRDLIRKEFQHLINEMSDETSSASPTTRNEELLNKGVANIMENLNYEEKSKKDSLKSFSRVKINGNNKPLLQITFSRSGENSLQVLDNCVNVTICDNGGREKLNQSIDDTLTEDVHVNSLKRCQAFNALQEARSTEDLYIDDDLSTMPETFGGKVKLIPLHGSLHEILCEKEDDCCLIKVKQENGCDTIYFRCDNSDTESRDAIDGCIHDRSQDTVVFKRSISLVEERIQRIFPIDKRSNTPILVRKKPPEKVRPKSEIILPKSSIGSLIKSVSTPSLPTSDEVEVNIENVVSYQDSSSDECLRCQVENDDFELMERKIEEDLANSYQGSIMYGGLEKISEENLLVLTEDVEKH